MAQKTDPARRGPAGPLSRRLRSLWSALRRPGAPPEEVPEGWDHWEEVGRAQFDYLLREGLRPGHRLLDLPCGSFRAGRFLVDYLDPGNYAGVDGSEESVAIGRRRVLEPAGLLARKPAIRVATLDESPKDFRALVGGPFDYVWVHALFDHIPHAVIGRCLADLAAVLAPEGRLYATIFLNPHGPAFREPMVRPRNGALERAVVTFPDREYWHHTLEFFHETLREIPALRLDACLYDYPHPLGLRMLRFLRSPGSP